MVSKIDSDQDSIRILIDSTRLEGQNSIFEYLLDQNINIDPVDRIIFDFSKVEYINSLGIAEFISLMKYYSEKKKRLKFKFYNVDKKIAKVFKMIELGTIADIETK